MAKSIVEQIDELESIVRDGGGAPDPAALRRFKQVANSVRVLMRGRGGEKASSVVSLAETLFSDRKHHALGAENVRVFILSDLRALRSRAEDALAERRSD